MTQKDKELLLKDLCARLPYGVKVERNGDVCEVLGIIGDNIMLTANVPTNQQTKVVNIKPYLRPMSSMTEEEAEEFRLDFHYGFYIGYKYSLNNKDGSYMMPMFVMRDYFDWLNKHHFDYRGLIEKGLALEAPEGMYDIKD